MSSIFHIIKFIQSGNKKKNRFTLQTPKFIMVTLIPMEFMKTMIQNLCSRTSKYHKSKCKQPTQGVEQYILFIQIFIRFNKFYSLSSVSLLSRKLLKQATVLSSPHDFNNKC